MPYLENLCVCVCFAERDVAQQMAQSLKAQSEASGTALEAEMERLAGALREAEASREVWLDIIPLFMSCNYFL